MWKCAFVWVGVRTLFVQLVLFLGRLIVLCVCACVQVCKCASMQVCKCASVQVCKCASMQVCKCVSVFKCACVHVCMYVYVYMSVCGIHAWGHVCTCECGWMCVCMWVCFKQFLLGPLRPSSYAREPSSPCSGCRMVKRPLSRGLCVFLLSSLVTLKAFVSQESTLRWGAKEMKKWAAFGLFWKVFFLF